MRLYLVWNPSMCRSLLRVKNGCSQLLRPKFWRMGYNWNAPVLSEQVILIGAVDNNRSRQLCHSVFYQMDELIYIDSGNGEYTGQVVCGIRRGGRTLYSPVGKVYPDVLKEHDKFPTELSCAEASLSAPQSIAANITAATAVVDIIYNILALGGMPCAAGYLCRHNRAYAARPCKAQEERSAALPA